MPLTTHFLAEHSVSKSRRKPRVTNRILPQSEHHDDLYRFDDEEGPEDDDDGMQTQPLNLSQTPDLKVNKLSSGHQHLKGARHLGTLASDDDVLDLSRSRSDAESEPEPIEEDEDEEEDEESAKSIKSDEEMESELSPLRENGQDGGGFKGRHHAAFTMSKHYSSNNHISNNNNSIGNHCSKDSRTLFAGASLSELTGDPESLKKNGNGNSSLYGPLEALARARAKLDSLSKLSAAVPSANGSSNLSVPLRITSLGESKMVAEALANE